MENPIKVHSGATIGIDALTVEVEVDATPGLPVFTIVGLPDITVRESSDRIASAIKHSGFTPPKQKNRRIIVNLAPSNLKKQGPSYDLAIAIGYLLATQQIKSVNHRDMLFFGELSLDGSLRKIPGILPYALLAAHAGFDSIVVPHDNAPEAAIVPDLSILPAKNLKQVVEHLIQQTTIEPYKNAIPPPGKTNTLTIDFADIGGQERAKRALTIAAAGGHNVLMHGPPGSGKTMLAQALPSILPAMSQDEIIETTKIYSIAGLLSKRPLIQQRPFRNPHHSTSSIALIGGGSVPRPGEISLAHHGILFLDEIPEFPRSVIESLREPLESGEITVARAAGSLRFPARCMLVAAMNPCPCGNYGSEQLACECTAVQIRNYQRKLSGPMLDRIDIQINVPRETYDTITNQAGKESSQHIQQHVVQARAKQLKRFNGVTTKTNSTIASRSIKKLCETDTKAQQLLRKIIDKHHLSARSYHKILKIARTIADLDDQDIIQQNHIAEAVSYRLNLEN